MKKQKQFLKNTQRTYNVVLEKINKLVDKNLEGTISDEVYTKKMAEYEKDKKELKKKLDNIDNIFTEDLKTVEEAFSFAKELQTNWKDGREEIKRMLLANLGSNLLLKDRKVFI